MKQIKKIKEIGFLCTIKPLVLLAVGSLLFLFGIYLLPGKTAFNEIINAFILVPISTTLRDAAFSFAIIFSPFGAIYLIWKSIEITGITIFSIIATCIEKDLSFVKELVAEHWKWFGLIVLVVGMMRINPITAIASLVAMGIVGVYAVYRFIIVFAIIMVSCKPETKEEFNPLA